MTSTHETLMFYITKLFQEKYPELSYELYKISLIHEKRKNTTEYIGYNESTSKQIDDLRLKYNIPTYKEIVQPKIPSDWEINAKEVDKLISRQEINIVYKSSCNITLNTTLLTEEQILKGITNKTINISFAYSNLITLFHVIFYIDKKDLGFTQFFTETPFILRKMFLRDGYSIKGVLQAYYSDKYIPCPYDFSRLINYDLTNTLCGWMLSKKTFDIYINMYKEVIDMNNTNINKIIVRIT